MKKLIIGLVVLLTCSACEKTNNDDEVVEWQGSFLDMESGYGLTTGYLEYDLPNELLNMLQYSTLEKDSAVCVGIGGTYTKSDYEIRIKDNKCYITFGESSKGDSLMSIRHFTFYTFQKGIFGRAEVTEKAIIVDGGAWKLDLQSPYQYHFSSSTGKSESRPFDRRVHYSGEFQVARSEESTILENMDYTFELNADGKLVMLKPTRQEIGYLDRK